MKRYLITLLAVVGFTLLAQQSATTTSDITFSAGFTGTPNKWDRAVAIWWIDHHNSGLAEGVTPLPKSTGPEIKASYLSIISGWITLRHQNKIDELISLNSVDFTPRQRGRIFDKIHEKIAAGADVNAIITGLDKVITP